MTLEETLKKDLNSAQFTAATHMDGPAVIMAGAGSGKTHTLISRVSYLISKGVAPESILMLTFTNAAADEMKARASKLLDERCANITACTYHSFCNEILRQHGRAINLGDYEIVTASEMASLIAYVKGLNAQFDHLKGFPSNSTVADIISKAINMQLPYEKIIERNYQKYRDYIPKILLLIHDVKAYCEREHKLTFDDLLVQMNLLLESPRMAQYIGNRYKYIMVDEFQDTNSLQEAIILKIAVYNQNIMVVGDISQSIYAFRGADVTNLQNFHTKLDDCALIVLDTNYRSTQQILDLANAVMNDCVQSWKYYDMVADNRVGNMPYLWCVEDNMSAEASAVYDKIMKHHNQDGVPYSDMAVLYRGSKGVFVSKLENMLVQHGIPYDKRGGVKFGDSRAVLDMMAYFKILCFPHNAIQWARVLALHPGVGGKYSSELASYNQQDDFLRDNRFVNHKWYREALLLRDKYNLWRSMVGGDFMRLFDDITAFYLDVRSRAIEDSRMDESNKEDARVELDSDKETVAILRQIASEYHDISVFLDDISLESVRPTEDTDDALVLSTVHSAKGLEWKIVFIVDCVEGLFPRVSADRWYTPEDEEELRCFYVAMTRAKDILYLMKPLSAQMGQGFGNTMLSHYLSSDEVGRTYQLLS